MKKQTSDMMKILPKHIANKVFLLTINITYKLIRKIDQSIEEWQRT